LGNPTPPPSVPADRARRDPRYAAEIEVHVAFDGRSLITLTREISRSGLFFFAEPAPEIGTALALTLHPEGRAAMPIRTHVRYVLPGVGAGVEVAAGPDADKFRAFVDDQSSSQKAWQVIGGFVRSAIDSAELLTVEFEQKETIAVGENCEAYRILFERHPAVRPDLTSLRAWPAALEHAKAHLAGVSKERVGLKLNSKDRLRTMHIGVLRNSGGFAAILPPQRSKDRFSFYSLSGREQIMVKEGTRDVFPFFTAIDLRRIRADGVSELHSGKDLPAIPIDQPGFVSARYANANDSGEFREELVHDLQETLKREIAVDESKSPAKPAKLPALSRWTEYDENVEDIVAGLFDMFEAETRVYTIGGVQRLVRLLRNLTIVVKAPDQEPEDGILLHDGKRVCVLVGMKSRESMRIRPLLREDEIRIPCW
jgi:PilZ domain-containing protein